MRNADRTTVRQGRRANDQENSRAPDSGKGYFSSFLPNDQVPGALGWLRGLPGPRGQVEVVAPGGDLAVADLEGAHHRQCHRLRAEEPVDALGEDGVAGGGDVGDLELGAFEGGHELLDHALDGVLALDRLAGDV